MKQNLHTHTVFCDGKDTPQQMARTAIEKGFASLGFSSHGQAHPQDGNSLTEEKEASYIYAVMEAQSRYREELAIFLGVEEDMTGRVYDDPAFDYVIASVHFLPTASGRLRPVDLSEEEARSIVDEEFGGDFLAYARAYYNEVKKIAERPEADIVGHLDLIMKYNEKEAMHPFEDPAYLALAKEAVDVLVAAGKIFEINTGAIARGYRSEPYPHASLLGYIREKGGKICITSDCHDRRQLDCGYGLALARAKAAGFGELQILTEQGFVAEPI